MTDSLFKITPTPPTSIKLAPGQEGKLSFTVESLAAPDRIQEVILQALELGDDGRGKEVDWLVAGPQQALTVSGGKTETVAIIARPTAATPRGEHRIKLVVADKNRPNDLYTDSPSVACEVIAADVGPRPPAKRPWWLIAAIAGAVVVVGGGLLAWRLWPAPHRLPGLGEPCAREPADACAEGLVCDPTAKKCLGSLGAPCASGADCVTGQCTDKRCANKPAPQCGRRGQPCCSGTCDLRASCDGAVCIAADVWASGADGTANFNGGTWARPLLTGSTAPLPAVNGLWGTSANFVVGVGADGRILRRDSAGWHRDATGAPGGKTLYAVAGTGTSDVWAVGDGDFAHYDGSAWSHVPAPGNSDEPYFAVWLSQAGEGWACGQSGVLARLSAGQWSFVSRQGNGFDKSGLWGSGPNDVWMVGQRHSLTGMWAEIRHFDGTAWKAVPLDTQSLPSLRAVWGSDATHVWAVGEKGTILFWNGTLWRPVLSGTADDLTAIWGSGPNDVWLAGSGGMRHFNGSAWTAIPGLTSPPVAVWLSRD